ncbi:MAG: hypothetical protein EOP11_06705 [Proteobacteria bacterium]|nr:MAG: hypothetical protein EOP11_06705 [Pseudomonadota bacterium]
MFLKRLAVSLLFSLLPFIAHADDKRPAMPNPKAPAAQKAIADGDLVKAAVEMQPRPDDGIFQSIFPLVGYEPTYGAFVGGGYFRRKVEGQEPQSEWSIVGLVSQQLAVKMEYRLDRTIGGRWRLIVRNELGNGFESNYGLGNDTSTANRVDVELWKDELDVFFPYAVTKRFRVGPWIEHRIRRNHRQDPAELARQLDRLPDREATLALGFKEELDFRDVPENPSLGWRQALRVMMGQPYSGPVDRTFLVIDTDIQLFQYLMNKDLVLATSLAGGVIFGDAPFLSQFKLGGTDRLRGFYNNRFRGSKYYIQQSEIRFPIWDLVSGASFLEFGEATERHFSRANVSYGAGLRIGIPPDKVSKVRIDYAMSRDQQGVFVDFAHAF